MTKLQSTSADSLLDTGKIIRFRTTFYLVSSIWKVEIWDSLNRLRIYTTHKEDPDDFDFDDDHSAEAALYKFVQEWQNKLEKQTP